MATAKIKDLCNSCRFFVSANNFMGQCHRYPEPINKAPGSWCGEWRLEESVAIEAMVQQVVEPVVISEPKKQRGRPKKLTDEQFYKNRIE